MRVSARCHKCHSNKSTLMKKLKLCVCNSSNNCNLYAMWQRSMSSSKKIAWLKGHRITSSHCRVAGPSVSIVSRVCTYVCACVFLLTCRWPSSWLVTLKVLVFSSIMQHCAATFLVVFVVAIVVVAQADIYAQVLAPAIGCYGAYHQRQRVNTMMPH